MLAPPDLRLSRMNTAVIGVAEICWMAFWAVPFLSLATEMMDDSSGGNLSSRLFGSTCASPSLFWIAPERGDHFTLDLRALYAIPLSLLFGDTNVWSSTFIGCFFHKGGEGWRYRLAPEQRAAIKTSTTIGIIALWVALYTVIRLGIGWTLYLGVGTAFPSFTFPSMYFPCMGGMLPMLWGIATWAMLYEPFAQAEVELSLASKFSLDPFTLAVLTVFRGDGLPEVLCGIAATLVLVAVVRFRALLFPGFGKILWTAITMVFTVWFFNFSGDSCAGALPSNWDGPVPEPLLSVVVPTAPRNGDPDYLLTTLQSWADALPHERKEASWSGSVHISVLNMAPQGAHPAFAVAKEWAKTHPVASTAISWIETGGASGIEKAMRLFGGSPWAGVDGRPTIEFSGFDRVADVANAVHRLDYSAAAWVGLIRPASPGDTVTLGEAMDHWLQSGAPMTSNGTFVMFQEDDFPLCTAHTYGQIRELLCRAQHAIPQSCGGFTGAGGSGIIVSSRLAWGLVGDLLNNIAPTAENKRKVTPVDLYIIDAIRGREPTVGPQLGCGASYPGAAPWSSGTVLMHHIGSISSFKGRQNLYQNDLRFYCGWREHHAQFGREVMTFLPS